jgi:MoaA/NifB/PqqE/SkfB family radical SAM enzyme
MVTDTDKIFKENIQLNRKEIQDKKAGLSSRPIRLNAVLTTNCNLSCLMCEVKKISWQIPQKTISEIVSFFPYLQEIVWQGGEVFLLDYFRELLEEASECRNLSHEITTNGHLINNQWLDIFDKINLTLNISIDGITKETYEHIRKGSKFEDLIRTLNLLNEIRSGKNANPLTLVLIVTTMKSNYREIRGIMRFAKKYKFDRVILQPVKGNFDKGENIFFDNDERILNYLDNVRQMIRKEAKDFKIKLVELLPIPFSSKNDSAKKEINIGNDIFHKGEELLCYAPWQQMFIEWGGNVYPHCLCIQDGPNELKLIGSVLKESLAEIWNGDRMRLFRKKISGNDFSNLCNPDCIKGLISADAREVPLKL